MFPTSSISGLVEKFFANYSFLFIQNSEEKEFYTQMKAKVKTWVFFHLLVGIWFPSLALGGWSSWLGPGKSVDFDAWHGLPLLIMMVALLAVWSSLSRTSKVMLGSMALEELSGRVWAIVWVGSGVHCSGNMPSSNTWALETVRGLCGGSDAHRFLLMGILGGGDCFIWIGFSLPKK